MANHNVYRPRGFGPESMWLQLTRAALWLVSRPFVWFYRLGNLIFDFKARGSANNLTRLTQEVESDYGFLFDEFGGKIVPEQSSGNPSFDWAILVIDVKGLLVKAVRDRGFTEWYISLNDSKHPWEPLNQVLERILPDKDANYSMYRALKEHLPDIERTLSD
jgi:hypothetical protein